jgi:flagellar hook-length control protein FliK
MRAADQSFANTIQAGEGQPTDEKASAVPELSGATNLKTSLMDTSVEKTLQPSASHAFSDGTHIVEKQVEQPEQSQKMAKSAAVIPPASTPPVFEKGSSQPTVDITHDPARLADVRSRELINQVTRHIDMSISQGRNSLRVQLFPEDMGRINLHLSNNANGLTITLIADQQATNLALAKQFDQLRQTLADAGIQYSELNIGQNGSFQQQSNPQQSSRSFHQGTTPRKEVVLEDTDTPVLKDARGSIDYRI